MCTTEMRSESLNIFSLAKRLELDLTFANEINWSVVNTRHTCPYGPDHLLYNPNNYALRLICTMLDYRLKGHEILSFHQIETLRCTGSITISNYRAQQSTYPTCAWHLRCIHGMHTTSDDLYQATYAREQKIRGL